MAQSITVQARPEGHSSYRADIDGLRGIAVLVVVAFHAFSSLMPGGFIGVDVFFVISGYLITGLILKGIDDGTFRMTDFYQRRIRRIFPALVLVLSASWTLGWLVLTRTEFINLGKHIFAGAFFVSNFFYWWEVGYFDVASEYKPLLHLWSLAIEEQFYLLWPVVILLASKRSWNVCFLLSIVLILSLSLNLWGSAQKPSASFYFPITRVWELACGSLLAYLERTRSHRSEGEAVQSCADRISCKPLSTIAHNLAAGLGFILIAIALVAFDESKFLPLRWVLLPTAGAFLLIGAGPQAWINRKILGCPPLVAVGLISYPLYLWHWPLLSYARIVHAGDPGLKMKLGALIASFVLAWLTYRIIEKPIRLGRLPVWRTVALLMASIVGLGVLGLASYVETPGSRLNTPAINQINLAANDWDFPDNGNIGRTENYRVVAAQGNSGLDVILTGDSHIEQYWSRALHVTRTSNIKSNSALFLTHGNCPPLPRVNLLRPTHSYCHKFYDFVLQRAQSREVKAVVFGAFWEQYFMSPYMDPEVATLWLYDVSAPSKEPLLLDSVAFERILDLFSSQLTLLKSQGKSVYIVLSNPTSPLYDPQRMLRLSRTRRAGNLDIPRVVDKEGYVNHVKTVMIKLKAVASRSGSTVIDPIDYICGERVCPTTTKEGNPVYKDSQHLRPFFVREKALFIDQVLLR